MIYPDEVMKYWEGCESVDLSNYYTKPEVDEKIAEIEVSGTTPEQVQAAEVVDGSGKTIRLSTATKNAMTQAQKDRITGAGWTIG